MKCIETIIRRLESDPNWGVYDGALSRDDLMKLVTEFRTIEHDRDSYKNGCSRYAGTSDGYSVCSSIF